MVLESCVLKDYYLEEVERILLFSLEMQNVDVDPNLDFSEVRAAFGAGLWAELMWGAGRALLTHPHPVGPCQLCSFPTEWPLWGTRVCVCVFEEGQGVCLRERN